jgi:hypothetical protein
MKDSVGTECVKEECEDTEYTCACIACEQNS